MEGTGKANPVHSVWSRNRDIFPDSPLFEASSSVRPAGTKKKETRPSVHPSARGFPRDCIREIAIYECRYCAAGYPLDIEGSERSSRENCPLRHDPANRDVGLPSFSCFWESSLGRLDVTMKHDSDDGFRLDLKTASAKILQDFLSYCLFCLSSLLLSSRCLYITL